VTEPASPTKKPEGIKRRFFFKKTSSAVIFGGALAYGLGSAALLKGREDRLRPPGALEEKRFLASCIKCGQCLQVCPPQVIKLAGLMDGFGTGVPYIIPREGACILCKGLPCVLACPTGALDHHISEGSEAEMGITVLSHPETCLARMGINDIIHQLETLLEEEATINVKNSKKTRRRWNRVLIRLVERLEPDESLKLAAQYDVQEEGPSALLRSLKKLDQTQKKSLLEFARGSKQARTGCRICLQECPIRELQPIRFEKEDHSSNRGYLPVVNQTCVGCGVCEERCPTEEASIEVIPRKKWKPRKA